jgi:hypothetical protein
VLQRLAEPGVEDARVEPGEGDALRASGIGRVPVLVPELGAAPLWMQLPLQTLATADATGEPRVVLEPPETEVLAEGLANVRSLLVRGELALPGQPARPRATHEIAVDEQGRRCLRRRGFAEHQRVAFGLGRHQRLAGDVGRGAGAVVHDDRLPELPGRLLGVEPGNDVGGAPAHKAR